MTPEKLKIRKIIITKWFGFQITHSVYKWSRSLLNFYDFDSRIFIHFTNKDQPAEVISMTVARVLVCSVCTYRCTRCFVVHCMSRLKVQTYHRIAHQAADGGVFQYFCFSPRPTGRRILRRTAQSSSKIDS